MHTYFGVALKPNFMSSQLQRAVFPNICIFFNNSQNIKSSEQKVENICIPYIWSKMLSSTPYTMLKLWKTTSSNKLFDNDCVTLYMLYIKSSTIEFNKFFIFIFHFLFLIILWMICPCFFTEIRIPQEQNLRNKVFLAEF